MRGSSIFRTAFNDLVFICCFCFVVLFVLAVYTMAVKKKDDGIQNKAEFIVTMTWPANRASDIDLWIEDPLGNVMYYSNKEVGIMHLDRDDKGNINDVVTLPNGQQVRYDYNQEIACIRGIIAGEWTINSQLYNWRDNQEPIDVTVKVEKINPRIRTVLLRKVTLSQHGQETTIGRMDMLPSGDIIGIDYTYKKLTKLTWARPQ